LPEFVRKLNKFASDKNNIIIFDPNILSRNHFYITGSIMAYCLSNISRDIMDNYANADIDIIFCKQLENHFTNQFMLIFYTHVDNLIYDIQKTLSTHKLSQEYRLECIKKMLVYIDLPKLLNFPLLPEKFTSADIDKIPIDCATFREFKTYILNQYTYKYNIKKLSELSLDSIRYFIDNVAKRLTIDDIVIVFGANINLTPWAFLNSHVDHDIQENPINNNCKNTFTSHREVNIDMGLYFSESIKFKLKFKEIPKVLEIFTTNNVANTVGKFHLPCVRSFYTGDNVYMFPSCVTAHMTGYNIDYKYFSANASPMDIIHKYQCRGFSTILNPTEYAIYSQLYYANGNNNNNEIRQSLTTDIKNNTDIKDNAGNLIDKSHEITDEIAKFE
jgi:hypothetical protein